MILGCFNQTIDILKQYLWILKTSFATVIKMYLFLYVGEKIETNIRLEEPFYLLTKTWKYGRCVFGPEVAG